MMYQRLRLTKQVTIGPALNESWAALNASRFIMAQEGYTDREELTVADRYTVSANLLNSSGQELYHGVAGLHSSQAGIILEKLDASYPGLIAIMTDVADSKRDLTNALDTLKTFLPPETVNLLNMPKYSAWQELMSRLDT